VNPASRGTNRIGREQTPCKANEEVPLGHRILQDFGLEILKFKRSDPSMSPALQELLRRCMATVGQVWPDVENAPGT
jgi:hypothetical protein